MRKLISSGVLFQDIDIEPRETAARPTAGVLEAELVNIPISRADDKLAKGDCCCICLLNFEVGEEVRVLACQHTFHAECVTSWFKMSTLCPLCKDDVRSPTNRREKRASIAPGSSVSPEEAGVILRSSFDIRRSFEMRQRPSFDRSRASFEMREMPYTIVPRVAGTGASLREDEERLAIISNPLHSSRLSTIPTGPPPTVDGGENDNSNVGIGSGASI